MKTVLKMLQIILYALVALIILAVLLRMTPIWDKLLPATAQTHVDFANLSPAKKPNWFLLCEEGACRDTKIHAPSPILPYSAPELKKRFLALLAEDGNSNMIADTDNKLEFNVRTAMVRWPDLISVEFVAKSDDSSTLYIYSRSIYGRSDLGANKARVNNWLARLK
jgi:uncharacterized protein (DUF1499 family)